MLFWIIVIAFVVGCLMLHEYETHWDFDVLWLAGFALACIGVIGLVLSCFVGAANYTGIDGYVAADHARYDMLRYQLESDMYKNDNDIGKYELMTEILEWNEHVIKNRVNQDDFWIGIYIPNIYDQFEVIDMEEYE